MLKSYNFTARKNSSLNLFLDLGCR